MTGSGFRVALLGATGSVGAEILDVLEERSFPVRSLHAFASEDSEGVELEFLGQEIPVERLRSSALAGSDLVFSAAPFALTTVLEEIRASGAWLVDVTGTLELDTSVPLFLPGRTPLGDGEKHGGWVAIPRGCCGGIALALEPLQAGAGLERVTLITLESASGAGRRGVQELGEQTVQLLHAMTGEAAGSGVFPRSLAFDCLPLVGEGREGGASSEEWSLVQVLRRLLAEPALPVEATRVRVPVFSGSLVCVHLRLGRALDLGQVRALWEKRPELEILPCEQLPTPRSVTGRDRVRLGRVRVGPESPRLLSFVLAMDDLRYGSALAAVLAAEACCRIH